MTIGQFIETCLLKGKSAQETLDMTQQVYKGCSTTLKSVYFYSSKLKREGRFKGLSTGSQANPTALKNALALLDGQAKKPRVRKAKTVEATPVAEAA